jgi:membrane-associated protease RseP (regulator of RpoE activity)
MVCSLTGADELALCDHHIEIEAVRFPMFNVAVAGSIVMYHRLHQRSGGDHLGGDVGDAGVVADTSSTSGREPEATVATAPADASRTAVATAVAVAVANGSKSSGRGSCGCNGVDDDGRGIRTVVATKVAGAKLGLSFASEHEAAHDPTPLSHTVVQLAAAGAAAAAGARVGDTIVAINNTLATGKSHEQVNRIFEACDATVKLTLLSQ